MEIEQYTKLIQKNSDWLPGKDAIANEIKKHCSSSPHFIAGAELTVSNPPFNGIFVYEDGDGCIKLTTCGLTQISPSEYALGQNRSGWGTELSVTLHDSKKENLELYEKLLVQLAQYVNVRKTMFTQFSRISLERLKFREAFLNRNISGFVFFRDVQLQAIETVHGSVDFLQVIGVNDSDWGKIKKNPSIMRQYIHQVKKYNPHFCIDESEILSLLQ